MNTHKHARLTFACQLEMVKQMTCEGWDAGRSAAAHGITTPPGSGSAAFWRADKPLWPTLLLAHALSQVY